MLLFIVVLPADKAEVCCILGLAPILGYRANLQRTVIIVKGWEEAGQQISYEKYKNLPEFLALQEWLASVDKRAWVVIPDKCIIDYEQTVVQEILKRGGSPLILQVEIPRVFAGAASSVLRKFFPNLRPFSYLRPQYISPQNAILPSGYYQAEEDIFLDVDYLAANFIVTFIANGKTVDLLEVRNTFLSELKTSLQGKVVVLAKDQDSDDEHSDEEEITSGTGEEKLVKCFGGAASLFNFDEYLNSYPPNVQSAMLRVVTLLDVIAERPASGLYFAALLAGEPGTGKSLFAQYLAKRALEKKMCVVYSFGYLEGVWLETTVNFALKNLSSVLFILDEAETNILSREQTYSPTLHFLMQLLDGYTRKYNASWAMIFITNRPHVIDPSFLRPERVEEVIEFSALDDANLAYSVFVRWCEKLGVSIPEGIQPSWFSGRTHAECAGIAHKLYRLQAFGKKITAQTVLELLKEIARWTDTAKLKGVGKSKGKVGF